MSNSDIGDEIANQVEVNLERLDANHANSTKTSNLSAVSDIKKVLFLQDIPCIRTNKIAKAIHEKGIQTDIIYLSAHPSQVYKDIHLPYTNIYQLTDAVEMIEFVNKSDYDLIYSSNEPDYLTVLFLACNKPIVHDTHDMMSLRANISVEQQVLEFIANVKCNGNIYIIPEIKDIAVSRFNLKNKPIFSLNNYIEKDFLPSRYLEKLSSKDGEIHCVFEGGLANFEGHHRYLEPIFLKLADNNIHIHLYCPINEEYVNHLIKKSKYIHYEGIMPPQELTTEMTKFDIGLAIFNLNEQNKSFLDTAFPNKIWDYLASGLPILFADLLSFRSFAERTGVGKVLDLQKDIHSHLEEIKNIRIEKDILIKNKWIMNEVADDIIDFLSEVKASYLANNNNIYQDIQSDNSYIYDQIYKTGGYNQAYFKHYSETPYIDMWNKALEIIIGLDNPKIIDIGCGPGQFANLLFDNGITDYKGIDFSREAIQLAKDRNINFSNLFTIDDIYTTNIFNDSYNTAILFEVLEHVEDDLSILNRIKSKTKILLSVPNFHSKNHVRFFKNATEIVNRYNNIIEIEDIYTFNINSINKLFLVIGTKR